MHFFINVIVILRISNKPIVLATHIKVRCKAHVGMNGKRHVCVWVESVLSDAAEVLSVASSSVDVVVVISRVGEQCGPSSSSFFNTRLQVIATVQGQVIELYQENTVTHKYTHKHTHEKCIIH